MPNVVYTYVGDTDPANGTGEILLRGGSLKIYIGQYASLTEEEVAEIRASGQYVIELGMVGPEPEEADLSIEPDPDV